MSGKTHLNKPITYEKIPFPKEELECIVEQIIKVHNANGEQYNYDLTSTIDILNQALTLLLTQPKYIMNGE